MFKFVAAPDEEIIKRKETCEICEHNKLKVCTKCGCIVNLKIQINSAKCPIGKW